MEESVEKSRDKVGICYYGDTFAGYQKVGEIADLIPLFKNYYYEKRIQNLVVKRGDLTKIVRAFNAEVAVPRGKKFHPYTTQLRQWIKKWDADIMAQKLQMREEKALTPEAEVRQVVKVRDGAPRDDELDAGVRTLGGELLNDAMAMLRADQALEEEHTDEMVIKRRNYVVNVFAHATKMVHGKAELMLKASEEKRNNASFLMTLLAKATAGTMSDSEVELLESAYKPKDHERDTIAVSESV